jgi:predicted nucleotidyltransferase
MPKTAKLANKKPAARMRRRPNNRPTAPKPRATRPRRVNGKTRVTPTLLQEMTRRLVAEFHPEQVILFGSHAWGVPTKDSDVDLMVIVSHSEETGYQRMVRAYDALIGLGLPKDVFVLTRADFDRYREVRASHQSRIAERGKVLYENKEPIRAEMVSHR